MTGWTPASRTWSPQRRIGVMATLVGTAWLTAGWRDAFGWPAPIALLWLATGTCHALVKGLAAMIRREGRRAAGEAALCVLFVGAAALAYDAIETAFHDANPC
jgi:hypothetical protein